MAKSGKRSSQQVQKGPQAKSSSEAQTAPPSDPQPLSSPAEENPVFDPAPDNTQKFQFTMWLWAIMFFVILLFEMISVVWRG